MARREGNFSVFVSRTLNTIGFSWQMILQRREFQRQMTYMTRDNLSDKGIGLIVAGSKREGVCTPMGGDTDAMLVFTEVICSEDVRRFENRGNLTVFEIDLDRCPPGYAQLVLTKHGGRFGILVPAEMNRFILEMIMTDSCCKSENGKLYLTSEIFINILKKLFQAGINFNDQLQTPLVNCEFNLQSRAGPSMPSLTGIGFFKTPVDNVPSLPCHCPSLFEKFRNRPRRHGWPSPDLLQELSQLDAHVVAVGDKMSENNFMQWRICFTQAEIRLIESLTEPQIHVFVLLKIFSKEVLKKTWDKMTSYVVKNVILWMAELTPAHKFQTDTIVERFLECLFFLKICVKTCFLPNYMISERNLLRQENFIVKRKQLLSLLEDCLYEKSSCLYKSEKLKEALLNMYSQPDVTMQRGHERDRTEQAGLSTSLRTLSQTGARGMNFQDAQRFVLAGHASEFSQIFFEKFSLEDIGRDPEGVLQEWFKMLHSHLK